jgi:5-methyltetrahydropteroyltriglutamate--homocysteine methyltransferase
MKRSSDRILVTHVGSLARPKDLMEMLVARNEGKAYDSGALGRRTREAVAEVVEKQIECGVDIVNDGELGKSNFSRYTKERLGGFVERPAAPDFKPTSIFGRDLREFTEYFNRGGRTSIGHHARVFHCVEPLKYIGQEEVNADIANLKAALQGKKYEEAFLPAVAPGTMEHWMKNEFYKSNEEYLFAIAEAMREEY